MPPPKRKSETSPDMKFAVQKLAKKWHGKIGKNRNIKFTSTPTTKVAKGRGMATKARFDRARRAEWAAQDEANRRSRQANRAPMPARAGHGGATGPKPPVKRR